MDHYIAKSGRKCGCLVNHLPAVCLPWQADRQNSPAENPGVELADTTALEEQPTSKDAGAENYGVSLQQNDLKTDDNGKSTLISMLKS